MINLHYSIVGLGMMAYYAFADFLFKEVVILSSFLRRD
jgi:hypothetical protein